MMGVKYAFVLIFFVGLVVGCQSNKKNKPTYSAQEVQEALLAYNKRLAENIHAEIDTFVIHSTLNFEKSKDGFYYSIIKNGNNVYPKEGDKVSCSLVFKLLDGTFCYPKKLGEVTNFVVGKHALPIVNSGVFKIDEKGEIEVIVSPYLGFGLNGDGKNIPPARPYLLNITLLKVNNESLK